MIKLINPPRSAAIAFGTAVALMLAVLAVSTLLAPAGARADGSVGVTVRESSQSIEQLTSSAKPLFTPYATARVKRCVVSRYYDGRILEFSGKMVSYGESELGPVTMQMRFEVFRKLAEHKRFKKVKGVGLGTWLPASDPKAGVYIREISLQGIETAAQYKARVTYRWLHPTGKVDRKRTLTTKPCKQRIGLPRLVVTKSKRVPIAGSNQENFVISVFNAGRSEAVNVPLFFKVDNGAVQGTIVGSIGPGQSVDASFNAAACQQRYDARIDPEVTLRLVNTFRDWVFSECPRDAFATQ